MYLIGGRRVMLTDLIEADLLKVGEVLRFSRRRMGVTYRAEVTDDGRVRLPDGQVHRSPSRAAMMAAGMRAVDGWHAWVVESTGKVLDNLRQDFLDRAVERSVAVVGPSTPETVLPQRVHDRLRRARGLAEADRPEEISVRDLLSLWGAKDRGDHVSMIEADLANHGLVTRPSFRKVTLDSTVQLITVARAADESAANSATEVTDVDDEAEDAEVGLTVGNLRSAFVGVVSVPPTASFEQAITRMLLDDFSQLAVMSSPRSLVGAVSWRSIAHARHANPEARFADAVTRPCEVRYDQDLVDVLADLQRYDFLFVRGPDNAISGIVTTADVVELYGEMATPFFLIGDLDQTLRRVIARNVAFTTVEEICNRRGTRTMTSFDDLTMGDYQRVLSNRDVWALLKWPLDRVHFVARLDEIREIRNGVMHFNPDAPPQGTVSKLKNVIKLLRTYTD